MPAIRRFVVTETREVKVTANNAEAAVQIAAAAFKYGQNVDNGVANGKGPEGVWGNTASKIKTTAITAYEE